MGEGGSSQIYFLKYNVLRTALNKMSRVVQTTEVGTVVVPCVLFLPDSPGLSTCSRNVQCCSVLVMYKRSVVENKQKQK